MGWPKENYDRLNRETVYGFGCGAGGVACGVED
jgi:hypothetical protein